MVVDGQLPHGSRGNCYNVGLMEPFLSEQNKPRFIKKKVRKNSEKGGGFQGGVAAPWPAPVGFMDPMEGTKWRLG